MDEAIRQLRTTVSAVRAADAGGMRDTLTDQRNQAERERVELAAGIRTIAQEIEELDSIIEQAQAMRVRKAQERADMVDAHAIKASSVAMLLDRGIRSQNS